MVAPWPDADLPHESFATPGERRNQPRLQHVILVAVARVLVLAEAVYRPLPGQHARVHGSRVHLSDLAVEAFHPVDRFTTGFIPAEG